MISAKAKMKHSVLDDHENALQFDVLPIGPAKGRSGGVLTPILSWTPDADA